MGWRTGLALALLVLLAPQHCECISAGARNLRSSGTWNSVATVQSTSPLGIAAYAGIASFFPLQQYMSGVASKLQRPLSSLLLDFERVYKVGVVDGAVSQVLTFIVPQYDNVTMFTPGKIGTRSPNPRHIDAVVRFADAYLNATAMSRNGSAFLLLYLLNGPGGRNRRYLDPGSPIAYGMPPGELNEALCNNTALRTELAEYVRALKMVLEPRVARGLEVRLTGMLEDNLNRTGALALRDVVVNLGGWRWAFGRNVCPGCTAEFASDDSRVGDYWERHINSCSQMAGLLELHEPGDNWSNDGWMGDIPMSVS